MGQRAGLPGVELPAFLRELARHAIGQGQVHVVAAEQDVLAHGHALQLEVAVALKHGDQRQVGGAAAHVHDEDDVAIAHLLAPVAAAGLDPAVQRGLGFLQQREVVEARGLAGLGRELARGGVERGGNGDGDVLGVEGLLGMGLLPGPAQVRQIADGGRQRRDALYLGRRIGRQQGAAAVHAGVAQPALGTGHQAYGRGRAARARHLADDEVLLSQLLRTPGQRHVGGREFAFVRQVQEGRQQGFGFHAGRAGELGNVQHALHHLLAVAGAPVHPGQRAVRGAQVYA